MSSGVMSSGVIPSEAKNLLLLQPRSRFFGLRPRNDKKGDPLMRFARLRALAAIVAGLLAAPLAVAAGSAEKGKVAYVKHGCWQCHGFMAQGGVTGPKLAPKPKSPDYKSIPLLNP